MRILLLSHFTNYWTRPYAEHLQAAGHDLLAVGFDRGEIPGVRSVSIGIPPWERNKHAYLTRARTLGQLARDFDADVVLATYVISNGLTAALGWRGPLVVSAHGYDLLVDSMYGGAGAFIRRQLAAFVCRRATRLHVVSSEMADTAAAVGVDRARIDVIPVGIDLARFPPRPDPTHAGTPCRPRPRIICTRRHEGIYDNETIIDAFARIAPSHAFDAVFVGSGPLTASYVARVAAARLADRVRVMGAVPHDELPHLLQTADVYVSASLVDGTSSALLEAMATGLTPVVSRITANTAWIDDDVTGLLFTPRDSADLARQLARALTDRELAARAATRNRRRVVDDGDLRENLRRLERVLVQAASEGRPVR